MIHVVNLSKSYGSQKLFDSVTLTINKGERIGLIGRNGHGKTTLMRMILGQEHQDEGDIRIPSDYTIGHLSQHIHFSKNTVIEEGCLGLKKNADGWDETYRVKAILHGLGFSDDDFTKDPNVLSGGYQVRLNLVKILVSEPNMLLLDEPTNYLDIVSMRWLERFLQNWPGELILITHDRSFMDRVITHVVGIHRGKIRKLPGTTDKYLTQIAQEEEIYEKTRINQERKIKETEQFIDRFRAKATKATAVQSRIKLLEKVERLDKLDAINDLDFSFNPASFEGKWLLEAKNVSFGYEPGKQLIEGLSLAVGKQDRIAVIGRNGKGKTTLLNLLAHELKPQSGTVTHSSNLKLGYFGQTNVERLYLENTVEEEILTVEESNSRGRARGVCGLMMFEGDAALKPIKVLSGGEKSRVLLGKILVQKANLLFLDEPTNHLDMQSSEALLEAARKYPGAIVMVTHNEEMLHALATRLVVFDGAKATVFEGTYQDFLERVGWSDEADQNDSNKAEQKNSTNKKELRKKRAEIVARRSKILGPLKTRLEKVEAEIVELEKRVEEQTNTLIEISKDGFGEDAAKISRSIAVNKRRVEELFDELETVTKEHDVVAVGFESELSEIE